MSTPEDQQIIKEVFGVRDLAKYLGVSRGWVYCHLSKIPRCRVGGRILFLRKAIDQWLTDESQASAEKAETSLEFAERKTRDLMRIVR
jgi:excisionase family DNA binding protein